MQPYKKTQVEEKLKSHFEHLNIQHKA